MRIAIFGGSFDPVHNGHVGIAKKALAELSLDKLFVIPAAVSPFKTSSSPRLSDDIRLECLYAAFSGVANVVIDTRELEKGGVSYAIDTVREYALEFPGAEIYFIIGEDSVEGLPRW
ncbi:MAG: nicotinate-nicotinamide nucleotide adenylyltransferase, partial [Kiritimatiellae bacterium]|nr:nicotinate-nicotinamide nucleotide adenylyltransferase [Kiritimatiellia bacterium]